MTQTPTTDFGITDLWPTRILHRRVGGCEAWNKELIKLVREMDRATKNLTTDYLEQDLFNMDHPAVNWLREEVNGTVIEYLRNLGIDYPVNWTITGWPNVNRFGDYHDPHNHPWSYLSGTYFVKMPTTREPLQTRSDVRPGCITFYDPRQGVNMMAIKNDPYVEPEHTVLPEPGLVMLWPAFVKHFVHPNLSKQTRISISFNIVLKWSDDYLPDQS
ncbi:MAG: hypothetical protein JKY68_08445 [Rhodospirillales bacterium]|nr:hypothetical protein [Rhodospirillales bacterium]